jgi:hypothetical protein
VTTTGNLEDVRVPCVRNCCLARAWWQIASWDPSDRTVVPSEIEEPYCDPHAVEECARVKAERPGYSLRSILIVGVEIDPPQRRKPPKPAEPSVYVVVDPVSGLAGAWINDADDVGRRRAHQVAMATQSVIVVLPIAADFRPPAPVVSAC